ncbi:MAG TPA: M3 family metallopeptidase, partial [Planctomycetota bacterium]|nr:M3 family metallopeptidase [Planctomycetota bacterium]
LQRARRYGVDSRALRPYLPYAAVRDGVLRTSEALYGVAIVRDAAARPWHPDVEAYDVLRAGRPIARFYLDMHPREGKYKHAAMFHLHEGVRGGDLPAACLVCNFPRPAGDDPGLLLFDDVTTFFHEFGHLLHHLFAGGKRFLAFSGIATEWDFVEVPSQLYEEWAWDPRVLQSFARHPATGEPIPAELVQRMRAAEEYGKGLQTLRQMTLAALALDYFTLDPTRGELDVTRVMLERKRATDLVPHEEGGYVFTRFGHLHGYSAMYYTYMWSFAIAKDLFERFEPDLLDRGVAAEYRERVLEPGGTRDASELVGAFLGRETRLDAFERWLER